mmetsp:Transcript_69538/g.165851  ORF Transcript_69538/g.165851 Transcript_69538/m.165851 type:complete len:259 (-) Transcript_69538:172-948(-)
MRPSLPVSLRQRDLKNAVAQRPGALICRGVAGKRRVNDHLVLDFHLQALPAKGHLHIPLVPLLQVILLEGNLHFVFRLFPGVVRSLALGRCILHHGRLDARGVVHANAVGQVLQVALLPVRSLHLGHLHPGCIRAAVLQGEVQTPPFVLCVIEDSSKEDVPFEGLARVATRLNQPGDSEVLLKVLGNPLVVQVHTDAVKARVLGGQLHRKDLHAVGGQQLFQHVLGHLSLVSLLLNVNARTLLQLLQKHRAVDGLTSC